MSLVTDRLVGKAITTKSAIAALTAMKGKEMPCIVLRCTKPVAGCTVYYCTGTMCPLCTDGCSPYGGGICPRDY